LVVTCWAGTCRRCRRRGDEAGLLLRDAVDLDHVPSVCIEVTSIRPLVDVLDHRIHPFDAARLG
jgi:hypothetical protein